MNELSNYFYHAESGANLPVFDGITKRKHIHRFWLEKKDFLYIDSGYFGNFKSHGNPGGTKLFKRIVLNDVQKHWLEQFPTDRWKSLCRSDNRLQWTDWKTKGHKILIIVPNRKACVFYGYDTEPYENGIRPWLEKTIATVRMYTDMQIVVREKASRGARHDNSIYEALDDHVFATVSFNSIAAIESVAYGIPAFVTVKCAASPLASDDLSQIATPFYPNEKLILQHCASLAYGQFTTDEITNGTARAVLKI